MRAVKKSSKVTASPLRLLNGGADDLRVESLERLQQVLSAVEFIYGPLIDPVVTVTAHYDLADAWVITLTHNVRRQGTDEPVPMSGSSVVYLPESALAVVHKLRGIALDLLAYEVRESMHYKGERALNSLR